MKLISRDRPWSYLWILFFEGIFWIVLAIAAFWFDMSLYNPPPGVSGFPIPAFTILTIFAAIVCWGITFLVIAILIAYKLRHR